MGNNMCMVDKTTNRYDIDFQKEVSKVIWAMVVVRGSGMGVSSKVFWVISEEIDWFK